VLDHVSDQQRVRIGLALVSVTVIVAAVVFVLLDSAVGRAAMATIVLVGIVRGWLLYRSTRAAGED
jgi:uncharacterized membrane protein